MFVQIHQTHNDRHIQPLNVRPEFVGGELLILDRVEIQVIEWKCRRIPDMVYLLNESCQTPVHFYRQNNTYLIESSY
jgi:hypothetical protein